MLLNPRAKKKEKKEHPWLCSEKYLAAQTLKWKKRVQGKVEGEGGKERGDVQRRSLFPEKHKTKNQQERVTIGCSHEED